MSKGPRNWSVSAGLLFEKCPLAFKFKYVDWVKMPKTEIPLHWRLGTVCHAGLEAAYRQRKAERAVGPMMTDTVWEAAKAAIAKSWAEEDMPLPEDSDGMWDRVHVMVENTLRDQEESWEDIFDVERRLFIRAGLNIVGYADLLLSRMPGLMRIRDWKSRKAIPSAEDLAKDFQLNLYGGMIYRMFPEVDEVEASHYMPPVATEVVVPITREGGEAAISRLRSIRDMVHHETEWPASKGAACDYCSFKSICPAWAEENEKADIAAQVHLF